jgi:hypothetical protein
MANPPPSEFSPRNSAKVRAKNITDAILRGEDVSKVLKKEDELEVTDLIALNAGAIRAAANTLAERITRFEEYLGNLPGRIETLHFGAHPDADSPAANADLSLVLKLHRQGKGWALSVGTHSKQEEYFSEDVSIVFTPLKDATLKFKIAAIRMFPDVLESITKTQTKVLKEIADVAKGFDEFLAGLPTNAKEGK